MTTTTSACAAGALLLASLTSAFASPAATAHAMPVPGTGGAWVYDGRVPPNCSIRDIRVRHFEGDGHSSDDAAHAHLGHGHKWSKRNCKGYPTKPPCYVRRVSANPANRSELPVAGQAAAIRNDLSGDLS